MKHVLDFEQELKSQSNEWSATRFLGTEKKNLWSQSKVKQMMIFANDH